MGSNSSGVTCWSEAAPRGDGFPDAAEHSAESGGLPTAVAEFLGLRLSQCGTPNRLTVIALLELRAVRHIDIDRGKIVGEHLAGARVELGAVREQVRQRVAETVLLL